MSMQNILGLKQEMMMFDTTSALAGMFLWIIFGYLSVMINCDIQRALLSNPLVVHACGFVAFIFLFTLLDTSVGSVDVLLIQSAGVYILFVLMTKSKWYFVLCVVGLLLADQLVKKHVQFKRASSSSSSDVDALDKLQKTITNIVFWAVIVIVIAGTAQYAYLQGIEYGANFSWYTLFIEVNRTCATLAPNYNELASRR